MPVVAPLRARTHLISFLYMGKVRRGRFFSGPTPLVYYMTRPGYFYALEQAGPRALTETEVDEQIREELLVEQPYEVHALAVAAERHAMLRAPHPDVR